MADAPATHPPHLSRKRAAAWFAEQGFESMTLRQLEKLAMKGEGPPYYKLGNHAYYRQDDLVSWLRATLRPAAHGRTKARAARGDSPVIAEADSRRSDAA